MVNRGRKSNRFECHGVILVAPLMVFKKVAKEPAVHFSIVVTGMFFLNYVADLEAVDRVVVSEERSTYSSSQLEEILSEDISDILKFQKN